MIEHRHVFGSAGGTLQRTPASTLDVYTIVSIFPKKIVEKKVTLDPGEFIIEPGTYEKPSVLTVTSAVYWNRFSSEMDPAEITTPAIMIANSVVSDYVNTMVGARPGECGPGLFYVEGKKTSEDIKKHHVKELDAAKARQDTWYRIMVEAADGLWARSNGNPVAIPKDSRLAAQELKLKDKPWMQDFNTLQMIACINCGNLRNPAYPSCPHCRQVVDPALYKKLGLGPIVEVK